MRAHFAVRFLRRGLALAHTLAKRVQLSPLFRSGFSPSHACGGGDGGGGSHGLASLLPRASRARMVVTAAAAATAGAAAATSWRHSGLLLEGPRRAARPLVWWRSRPPLLVRTGEGRAPRLRLRRRRRCRRVAPGQCLLAGCHVLLRRTPRLGRFDRLRIAQADGGWHGLERCCCLPPRVCCLPPGYWERVAPWLGQRFPPGLGGRLGGRFGAMLAAPDAPLPAAA